MRVPAFQHTASVVLQKPSPKSTRETGSARASAIFDQDRHNCHSNVDPPTAAQ